jgi:hypothetical protein
MMVVAITITTAAENLALSITGIAPIDSVSPMFATIRVCHVRCSAAAASSMAHRPRVSR